RDFGLEAGDRLIKTIAGLMKQMCSEKLQAASWTQKSIVFAIMNKSEHDVMAGLENIRVRYLESVRDITRLSITPGLRAVISTINAEETLEEQVKKLAGQLIVISKQPDSRPIQFYGETLPLKRKVLLADPDPVSSNIITHRLTKDGFFPRIVGDTQEIAALKDKRDIAVILVDTLVPEGGIEMVRALHRIPELAAVPIMILSRFGHEEEIAEAFDAGAEDYLMKPLSLVELSARVKRLSGQMP
ncbi:MAG: response regulator transcription factor, partial [Candidatus Marinimicrobia bacterium]|nr:response regulator transcription factor [Candidatus Neomarinimicrobiota bacterium]